MEIEETRLGDAVVVKVMVPRFVAANALEFRQKIADQLNAGTQRLVLDFSAVEFMDSFGLGAILSAVKMFEKKGELLISGARGAVLGLFRTSGLDTILRLFNTTDEALSSSRK